MNLKLIITLLVSTLYILLSFFIYRKNKNNSINITYSLMCLSAGLWSLSMAMLLLILANKDIGILGHFITRMTYFFGTMPPLFYLLFAYNFPYKIKVYSSILIKIIYLIPALILLLILFGALKMEYLEIVDGRIIQKTIFSEFLIFVIYFFIYVAWGIIILIKKYLKTEGIYKIQLRYLLFATLSSFITVGTTSVILPLVYGFKYDWLGPIFLLLHLSIISYFLFYKSRRV